MERHLSLQHILPKGHRIHQSRTFPITEEAIIGCLTLKKKKYASEPICTKINIEMVDYSFTTTYLSPSTKTVWNPLEITSLGHKQFTR